MYVLGLHAGLALPAPERSPTRCCASSCPPTTRSSGAPRLRQELYVALSARARARRAVLSARRRPRQRARARCRRSTRRGRRSGRSWEDKEEELFGPAEALHSTYRLLRDELLEGTMRAGGRLGELRFDTDLDVSHAVVRYLELLKLAALIARPEGQSVAEALRDVNSRILQAVTARAARDLRARRRSTSTCSTPSATRAAARRRSPRATSRRSSRSCPRRGEGVVLSAVGHRHLPHVPAEVQVRARVPDPAGADR